MATKKVLDLIERALGIPDQEPVHACGDDCCHRGCTRYTLPRSPVRLLPVDTKILRQHRPPRRLLMAKPNPA